MTVRELKRQLEHCNDDAIVYISDPNLVSSDFQTTHEIVGARLVVTCNEEVWFETYGEEAIDDEVDALAQVAEEENWDEWDFYNQLFNPNKHGYTLEDIRKNCPDRYEACKTYLETHAF